MGRLGLAISLWAGLGAGALAQPVDGLAEPLDVKEWPIPYEASRPRDPFAVSDSSVWFVGQRAGYLAELNPQTGDVRKIDLKPGSGPHNLIVGADGVVWYAGNRTALIGRYDPSSDTLEEIPMPDAAARAPHTLVFNADESAIWFTVQGGNFVGRLTIASREVDLIPVPTPFARPYGIKVAPDGTVWAVLFGADKLARINPETLALTEINLPRENARPRRVEITPDGRVWYGDFAQGILGAYDPEAATFQEWPLPQGENAQPYGMASDDQGRVYVVTVGVSPNVFQGFDPETETFFGATEIPSGGGTVRHMHYHAPTGAVWFGADTNTVGRVVVDPTDDEATTTPPAP